MADIRDLLESSDDIAPMSVTMQGGVLTLTGLTTSQKNALTSPATGAEVYDTTLNQKSYYDGTIWIDIAKDGIKSVAVMKTLNLVSEQIVKTVSYYASSSTVEASGGASYQVLTLAQWQTLTGLTTPDGYGDHVLNNGNVARLIIEGSLLIEAFGAPTGSTDTPNIAAAVARAKSEGLDIKFKSGDLYNLPKGAQTVSAYGVAAHSDPVYDVVGLYAIMLDGLEDLTIDATGANFTTNSGSPFIMYRCKRVKWIKGSFARTGSDSDINTDQAAAITITRSGGCSAQGVKVTGYYRNLFCYRSVDSGFKGECFSLNALYFNYYGASVIDITLTGYTDVGITSRQFILNNTARGGRHGNFFVENTNCDYNKSFDCLPSGNTAAHIKTERGNCRYKENVIVETSVQNSGDRIDGIVAIPPSAYGTDIQNIRVHNNDVTGTYQAYRLSGVDTFSCTNNKARDYYQTGFSFLTQVVSAVTYNLRRGLIANNKAFNMNDASTRASTGDDKNCGFQMEKNSSVDFDDVLVEGNFVDALGANTTKTPTYNTYLELGTDTVQFGENGFTTTATNFIPAWIYSKQRVMRGSSYVSTGSGATPTLINTIDCYDGVLSTFNSSIELPSAAVGMRLTIAASSGVTDVYLTGADSLTTSSNTVYLAGGIPSSSQKNIRLTGPGAYTLICPSINIWQVIGGNTAVALII